MSALNPEYIELKIGIEARYIGTRITGPCFVEDEVRLTIPYKTDPKFIDLAKVLQGVIPQVLQAHKDKVMDAITISKKEEKQLEIWGRPAYGVSRNGHDGSIGGVAAEAEEETEEDDLVKEAAEKLTSWIKSVVTVGTGVQSAEEMRVDLVSKLEDRDPYWLGRMPGLEWEVDIAQVLPPRPGYLD